MEPIFAYGPELKAGIESCVASRRTAVSPTISWGADFLERLLPFATSGKLLRGSITCFSYEAFSGQAPSPTVLNAAVALELTHSALLIHDDVMDKDDTRRGRPSMHRQYGLLAAGRGLENTYDFGTNLAICGGDAALFLAFELLAGLPPDPRAMAASQLFTRQLALVCAGQMQDIALQAAPAMPGKRVIYDLMRTKTAAYTLALPLTLGATLAGQPAATIKKLEAIGLAAGTIFQIRDDELGTMGTAKQLGKPVGSDITEGKKTLLLYYLLKACSRPDRARLRAVIGNPQATAADISFVRQLVTRYGVPASLNQDIAKLQAEASRHIAKLDVSDADRRVLKQLVAFCASRPA